MTSTHILQQEDRAPLPPIVKGLPLLGSALKMMNNPLPYLVELYGQYGPIFRLKALNRKLTVLAGPEANAFLAKSGETYLSSEHLFGGMADEIGTRQFLVALDGEPHREMRKLMRRGYSRGAIAPHLAEVIEVAERFAHSWPQGQSVPVVAAMQRLVTEQLALILTHRPPGEYFEDIFLFLNTVMRASVLKIAPAALMKTPSYMKAKERVKQLAREVLDWHRAHPPVDREPGLIDDMLAARDENGQPLPESTLIAGTIGPFFAGMDTVANTISFMLYAILTRPEVLARVQAEVDRAFADGSINTLEGLRDMKALYGATIETLRMYPVAAFTPRSASQAFNFGGCRVEAGTEVLVANGVTHYLPQFFPNPEKFDIDRYIEPRSEHRQANIFAPYSLGAHTCLGAGMAEVEVMVTVAALLHAGRYAVDPPNAPLKIRLAPVPSPGRAFKMKVLEHRGA